jgi:hypothetical protein
LFRVSRSRFEAHFLNYENVKDTLADMTPVNMEAFPAFKRALAASGLEQPAVLDVTYWTVRLRG